MYIHTEGRRGERGARILQSSENLSTELPTHLQGAQPTSRKKNSRPHQVQPRLTAVAGVNKKHSTRREAPLLYSTYELPLFDPHGWGSGRRAARKKQSLRYISNPAKSTHHSAGVFRRSLSKVQVLLLPPPLPSLLSPPRPRELPRVYPQPPAPALLLLTQRQPPPKT